jgi:multidrug efflux system outer membrane protein
MNKLATALAFGLLAGCSLVPPYERPAVDMPQDWRTSSRAEAAEAAATQDLAAGRTVDPNFVDERWWTLYADPVLDHLEEETLANNADAAIAAARVLEARALARLANADLYPTVTAGFSANRTRTTEVGTFPLFGLPPTQNDFRATLDASYEVDLWGKYRSTSTAARADLFAAEAARQSLRLSLTAQVAQQYFALIAADAQADVAQRTLATRDETLALSVKRVAAGTLSEYGLHQDEAEQAATRSQLAALRRAQSRAESALALLLGRSPRAVMSEVLERGKPVAADLVIPSGLPSELLLRRPDLQEAEQQLIAANARIGNARAQYFPSIALTAYLGSESADIANLFTGPAGIFQFAAGITQPIWNAGRLRAGVEISEARRDQALAAYRKAVANAFADLRDALAEQHLAREAFAADTARAVALDKALVQVQRRFDAGIASRLDVLDVERNLLSAELARIDSERARQSALADVFKALGGGWR